VKGKTWKENTPALVFSTTKGATAICDDAGRSEALDVDAPVAQYWPEFAAGGKADIPVRMLLNHQAGLPVVDATLSRAQVLEVTPVVDALAKQTPVWPPGSRHGYHALTYGWLVGELVRRITGKSIGRFFVSRVSGT
jgi:CubicO group peptidase (beta-lactamase class C family)